MKSSLRIATRKSPLALWQANHIKQQLQGLYPELAITLIPMSTQGDKLLDSPLSKLGGKGLFVKELERALLDHQADIAVHSMKDMPMELPEGLEMTTVCEREDPSDAFVSNRYQHPDHMPENATLGTSSLRRISQWKQRYPAFNITMLRGNVGTRLRKLDDGEYDAIVLASAGLLRLNYPQRIQQRLDPYDFLPACGQGAIGIEARSEDFETHELLAPLHHEPTAQCIAAERAMNTALNGGCQVPIAGFATIGCSGKLTLNARVASVDGMQQLTTQATGSPEQAVLLGEQVAQSLLAQGAQELLSQCH